MDLSSMMSNINPEMLKDLTPEKIQDALKNLPPNMKDMMQSMGELCQFKLAISIFFLSFLLYIFINTCTRYE